MGRFDFIPASHSIRRLPDRWRRIEKVVPSRLGECALWGKPVHHIHITILLFLFIPQRRSDVTLPYYASAIVS
jgi:hypothetical protein